MGLHWRRQLVGRRATGRIPCPPARTPTLARHGVLRGGRRTERGPGDVSQRDKGSPFLRRWARTVENRVGGERRFALPNRPQPGFSGGGRFRAGHRQPGRHRRDHLRHRHLHLPRRCLRGRPPALKLAPVAGGGCPVDAINARLGRGTVFFAAAGGERKWKMTSEVLSSHYTASRDKLLVVR